ncbi:hypothetical protein [Xanthomonas phage RTH11]|nr:hypothetical protein [Xanthomonas phage RTH11]
MSENKLKVRALIPQGRGIWLPSGEMAAVVGVPTQVDKGDRRLIALIVLFDDPGNLNQGAVEVFSKELIELVRIELAKDVVETRKLLFVSDHAKIHLDAIEYDSLHREV